MNNLSQLYKKLALKVHPDHGGSKREMQQLNKAYETFKKLSEKYLTEVADITEVPPNFRFPYPNSTFRAEDTVQFTENGHVFYGEIVNMKGSLGNYEITLKMPDDSLKTFIRKNLKCSEDPGFFLYKARWD